jgi:transposase InsO family protein
MDFFTVPTATFRILYVWFAIDHAKRRVLHFDVTDRPAAAWVAQQLREAFPHDSAIRHLIFDRDAIFSDRVLSTVNALGLRPTRTAYRSPWQNGVAERWVGSVRSELLDRAVVFNERHLRRLLGEYVPTTTKTARTTRLSKETPGGRQPSASESTSAVVASRRLGGLHHRYNWAVERLAG